MVITVVSLVARDAVTMTGWSRIVSADRLFLQTERHPAASLLTEAKLAYTPMDDLYDAAEDFDALNRAIAARLLAAKEDCVYAATGETETLLPLLKEAARAENVRVVCLPGVSIADAAFAEMASLRFPAGALPARLDPENSLAVTELDTALKAGAVKLKLLEYYPDDWQVTLARQNARGLYARETLPLCELDRQKRFDATTALFVPAASFADLSRYGVNELEAVIERLRAPGGCPWDREQTHVSLKGALLEECYEVLDAIDREDDDALCEELGDVLLQVVFHASIAAGQGRFTARDVATGIVQKLVYRHPHVFSDAHADTAAEVLVNWDRLKQVEKHQKTQTDAMNSVPKCFPALMRARKVQKKAAAVGFDWANAEEAFFKIGEETEELRAAMRGEGDIAAETGDLLFSVVNVARLLHLDPEFLLAETTDRFVSRFSRMEALAASEGRNLSEMTLKEQDELWEIVKKSPR